ncbi:cAMP-binding domain of CRP or a regulatory subunit of cAMP-dependent protein kinases [Lishizhenia tianjinensis]|uniref:cAMP-binding domain of CRP or a regulatory subunit of cAMP-dependent protein kinases n=1 Tax=Lishizhenia tianjinensis TaxID=477690 RepID=A0A1I6XGT3_9FLAO|nr:Crp/Fnr family transcriptional regulator [Lishizhenia tianjinensis]SFT37608.1 cAMP-binding domain of CRP or a regulatory subunit of cAMP-dependent protein kinases [Lishizhenia tianjinensis]
MELIQHIQNHFRIPLDEVAKVAALFQPSQLKKEAFYSKKGAYCSQLSFLQKGHIRIFDQQGDKEITQWIAGPGQLITDLRSFVFQHPSRWQMQCLDEVELFSIDRKNFESLHQLVPNWAQIEKEFISDCFITLENRVFSHLTMSAEERYLHFYNYNPELFTSVPQQYLASMLGMTPETFSRIRKKIVLS